MPRWRRLSAAEVHHFADNEQVSQLFRQVRVETVGRLTVEPLARDIVQNQCQLFVAVRDKGAWHGKVHKAGAWGVLFFILSSGMFK